MQALSNRVPSAATSTEATAGTVTNKYISPATLTAYLESVKNGNRTSKNLGSFSPRSGISTLTINDDWANYDIIAIRAYDLGMSMGSDYDVSPAVINLGLGSTTVPVGENNLTTVLSYYGSSYSSRVFDYVSFLIKPYMTGTTNLTAFVLCPTEISSGAFVLPLRGFLKSWNFVTENARKLSINVSPTRGSITVYGINF